MIGGTYRDCEPGVTAVELVWSIAVKFARRHWLKRSRLKSADIKKLIFDE